MFSEFSGLKSKGCERNSIRLSKICKKSNEDTLIGGINNNGNSNNNNNEPDELTNPGKIETPSDSNNETEAQRDSLERSW